jgi:hypothetical protein
MDDIIARVADLDVDSLERAGLVHDCRTWGATQWATWHDASPHFLKAAKKHVRDVTASFPDHHTHIMSKLLATPKGRGRFYRSPRGGWRKTSAVGSVRTDTGEITCDPDEYMPIIKDSVSKPFTTRKLGPAVLAWRSLTAEELRWGIPHWWREMYERCKLADPELLWDRLMRLCTPEEVFKAILGADRGKAPGHDKVTIDILKVAVGAWDDLPRDPDNPILLLLTAIVNACLMHRCCPSALKSGIIVLIPKPGKATDDVANLRPITLLPEIGKLTSRILANRLSVTLHRKPHLIHAAQRAYLRDGDSKQCVSALIDLMEDFQERARADSAHELVVTSYDIRKAFDSVHKFTIRASCERLNMPPSFIDYVIACLDQAESCVRCADGLTGRFQIESSVRQGDPLAAIVFILIMDALHCGLENNPLGLTAKGYTMMDGGPTVHSLGYSDDTLTSSGSWESALAKHEWVREFFCSTPSAVQHRQDILRHRLGLQGLETNGGPPGRDCSYPPWHRRGVRT